MKRIDDIDRIMPSEKARKVKLKRSLMMKAKDNAKAYLKRTENIREKQTKFVNKDRRRFLDMVSRAGISTSILRASPLATGILASRHATAQDWSNKRVVYCYLNSGAQNHRWLPSSATQMNEVSQPFGPGGYNVAQICNFRQVNVMQEGHANATQALGVPGYGIPTMDTRIAGVLGASTPYSAIYLGSQATTAGVLCSTLGPCTDDPNKALGDLFGAAPVVESDNTYLKVFEANHSALDALRSKLGQEELERLDTHAGALEKIENRLTAAASDNAVDVNACTPNVSYGNNIQSRGKAQADIIIAALQCGLTKVATLQLGNHQGDWYGHNTAYKGDAHNSCHSSGPETNDEMMRYLNDVPAYFLKRLMEENGPDGQKLIDSTVFVQVTCMGNGRDHTRNEGPFMVATQMSGFSNSFSSLSEADTGGTTEDLNGAIPRGLGIPDNLYETMGSKSLGLI